MQKVCHVRHDLDAIHLIETDHDRLFKELLTTFFWGFLDLFFPEVTAYTERSSLELLDEEVFIDVTDGERYEVDILVRARFRGKDAFFLVNVENHSSRQSDFGKRMFKYFARLYEKFDLPVYPIAVFSFDEPRRAEPDTFKITFPDRDVLSFQFRTIQLNRLNWHDYVASENPVASALMAKMRIADGDRQRVKLECLQLLLTLRLDRARMGLIAGFVDSYIKLSRPDEEKVISGLRAELPERMADWKPEEREDAMDWERLGREDGLELGLVKGREQKAHELALRQLTRKLGTLPSRKQERVAQLSPEQTDTLAVDLLDFDAVADLEAWLSANTPQ
jgi:hypothetical protein